MRTIIIVITVLALLAACTAQDFFQFRENTGLYVVEKPSGYGTAKFGSRIAVSSSNDQDYMIVSAGRGTSSLFYELSNEGELADISGYWKDYPGSATDFVKTDILQLGSGASLTGLPSFFVRGQFHQGCAAIGDPGVDEISIWCSTRDDRYIPLNGDSQISNFGLVSTGIKLRNKGQFLLAAGGRNGFQVFSDTDAAKGRSRLISAGGNRNPLTTLAGGILAGETEADDRVFIAATAVSDSNSAHAVYLFVQSENYLANFVRIACIENSKGFGFGGAMLARDLDGDGTDEFIVGSSHVLERHEDAVYILDVNAVAEAAADASACMDISSGDIPYLAKLTPVEGDKNIQCTENCSFGASLAAGDIATDDTGPELAIGAPQASVDDVSKAGVVYIFRGWNKTVADNKPDQFRNFKLASQLSDSVPERGQEFGGNLAIAPIAGRNELLVAGTGEGKVYIAYCTNTGTDINKGADVPQNKDGEVVSTRCRL